MDKVIERMIYKQVQLGERKGEYRDCHAQARKIRFI